MAKFAHLHCHSEFSKLDGGSRIKDMPEVLKELGFEHMALTDHGVMQGISEFHDTLNEAGIKPILGLEAYLTDDRHNHDQRKSKTWHLTLLAETDQGYRNLCKISSWAFIEGRIMTFGNPRARADWELLGRYSEGIICLTGCMAGPVMGELMSSGDLTEARKKTEKLIEIFGAENVYGELQNVGISTGIPGDSEVAVLLGKEPLSAEQAALASTEKDQILPGQVTISQTEANRVLVDQICKPLGLAYVGTGDVHYLREDDADPHDAMICIDTHQLKNGQRKFSLLPNLYHLRSAAEMAEALPEWPESLEETVKVAERCQASIQYGRELLPKYPSDQPSDQYLRELCQQGIEELYPGDRKEAAQERLDMELAVIGSMGFNDYFLIVWDLFREARQRQIPYGPGRGSAAGSIVAYCLGITQLCPLEHGLLFERFLNPDRKSMPDIDMDFGVSENEGLARRDELISYAVDKYNGQADCQTAVAQIVTFGKFKAKGALKDAARVLADNDSEGARQEAKNRGIRLAGLIPDDPRATMRSVWLDKEGEGKRLIAAYNGDPKDRAVIKQAGWMEGLVRNYGTHAAAVIIADHDLSDDLPLQQVHKDKLLEVQYDMNISERLGLLKMDFLGLRTLDVIWDTVELVKETRGVEIKDVYRDIPLDDEKTYELLAKGQSIGVFQFESAGMSSALRQIKPTEFNDLTAIVALYRPGPMVHIPTYAARKQGREEVSYLDERLGEILGESYGIVVFQEQAMLIARQLAGFTPGQADDLRKAIGKKLKDKMDALRGPYLKGCQENGLSKEQAETLWADNEAAADYSFNKSHAACYAQIAYITAYLKANYPEEYWASLMSSVITNKDKLRMFLTDAKVHEVSVLSPDVNRSVDDFTVVDKEKGPGLDVLFGLSAISGVNSQVVEQLIAERQTRGPFKSMFDLIRRQPKLSGKVVQALAQGGALDNLPGSRQAKSELAEESVAEIKEKQRQAEGQYRAEIKEWLKNNPFPGQETTARGLRKFAALETAGINKGATYLFGRENSDGLLEVLTDAIARKRLSDEKRQAKSELSAATEKIHGIASEDNEEEDPIEALAKKRCAAAASDDLRLAESLVNELEAASKAVNAAAAEQAHLLPLETEYDPTLSEEEWDYQEKLLIERSKLGIYVTGHPLDPYKREWAYYVDKGLGHIDSRSIGKTLRVVGAVTNVEEIRTRKGGLMAKVTLDDLTGSRQVTVWPDDYKGMVDLLVESNLVVVDAQIKKDTFTQTRNEEEGQESDDIPIQIFAGRAFIFRPEQVKIPENIPDAGARATLTLEEINPDIIAELKEISGQYPGELRLYVKAGGKEPVRTSLTISDQPEVFALLSKIGDIRSTNQGAYS